MSLKIITLTTLFVVLFTSCFDDLYYYFTDDERSLLVYDKGDAFVLLRIPQQDTLTFVLSDLYQDTLRSSPIGVQWTLREMYRARIEMDEDNFIDITAYTEEFFEIDIVLTINSNREFAGYLCDTLYSYNLNGQNYPELFVFAQEKGKSPMLYFSKDKGIVFIDSTASGSSYSLIELVKK